MTFSALGCGLLLLLSAAALSSAPAPRAAAQEKPELADGPGKDVVMKVCNDCHDAATYIVKQRHTAEEWAGLVTDMQNRGMVADDKELEVIVEYLATHYGPEQGPE